MLTSILSNFYIPADGRQLGLARLLFFSSYFVLLSTMSFEYFALAPSELWEPQSFFRWFDLRVPSGSFLIIVEYLFKASAFFSAIGLLSKWSMKICAICSLYLFGISNGFQPSDFHFNVLTLSSVVWAASSGGDFFSIDRFWKRRKGGADASHHISEEYGWPLQLIVFCLCFMYFSSGITKLSYSGWDWVTGKYLLYYIQEAQVNYQVYVPAASKHFVLFLIENHEWTVLLSSLTLVLELSSLVVLFRPHYLSFFLIIWLFFHLGIYFLMGISLSLWLIPVFLAVIPWGKITTFKTVTFDENHS